MALGRRASARRLLVVVAALAAAAAPALAAPSAVPTFESLGLTWSPAEGAADNPCVVSYRELGTGEWREGFPLVFDARDAEYRGSLVHLRPDTRYEIELRLERTGTSYRLEASTWSEVFPVAETVELPALSATSLVIDRSGSPDGYVLYTFGPLGGATIDVAGNEDSCVTIDASHVILRGLTLRNARIHGVRLMDGVHDVVIEECDISGWGRIDSDGWGVDYDSAVYSEWGDTDVERVIIQRNRMHHPRSDSNSWAEPRPAHSGELHPRGAQAVTLFNSRGNHVIRYNEVMSDADHYFNDIFGAGSNFSTEGFPNRDSDIYANHLSHCWDDAIESEGANRNVRIWGNFMEWTYVKVATASTATGPLYVWRNVAGVARKNDLEPWDDVERGGFLKTSDNTAGGRIFVFHNTLLQPTQPVGSSWPLGCSPGLGHGGPMVNVTSRNNILEVYKPWHASINDRNSDPGGDYDFDLYNGDLDGIPAPEPNGIHDGPLYDPANAAGEFYLDPTSPGYDAGERLAGFNDGFEGAGPDVGAHERGTPPMEFGVEAYRVKLYESTNPTVIVTPPNAVATAPPAPPIDHTPAASARLFYAADDRRGNPRRIRIAKGGRGLLVFY